MMATEKMKSLLVVETQLNDDALGVMGTNRKTYS